jgi:UDP-N-acetylglucosamine--N-acetylmuramyl-(pentapeptide) pyrophosphoryl-undecaprenol N-acetylglucosamine transferase
MDLRVVIAAGGTGGHLFPGIAVAQEFTERARAEVTFLTSPRPVTTQILERYGFAWETISSQALKGRGLFGRLRSLLAVPGSVFQARARLKALNPQLVLGMGGYTSGPVGLAAYLLGIPLALHEQNAIPGFANRRLARLARRIFVSFPAARGHFPAERCVWTGNPIRGEFFQVRPERGASPFTVLVTGGSQGAHHLNMEVIRALPRLQDLRERLRFMHLTGEADEPLVAAGYQEAGFAAEVAAFAAAMAEMMGRAHLVVSRAGASTLAEIAALGRAALLVPYPFAANNHQEYNARLLAEAGAAWMILNKDFTAELFAAKIREVIEQPEKLPEMEAASRQLSRPHAAQEIVQGCLELVEAI